MSRTRMIVPPFLVSKVCLFDYFFQAPLLLLCCSHSHNDVPSSAECVRCLSTESRAVRPYFAPLAKLLLCFGTFFFHKFACYQN